MKQEQKQGKRKSQESNGITISTTVKLLSVSRKEGPTQKGTYIGFIYPSGIILAHLIANLLLKYAKDGCKVNCGVYWSKEYIDKAIHRGPHIK